MTQTTKDLAIATAEAMMEQTPIFVDTLAATTKWGRKDAAYHLVELTDLTDTHLLDTFIEWYGAEAA